MEDPALARPDQEILGLLTALADRVQELVIISGRDTDQLDERLRMPSIKLIGNHGLEERQEGRSRLSPQAEQFSGNLERAAEAVRGLPQARSPGVRVERKRAAVSVHFRQEPRLEKDHKFEAGLRALAKREGLLLHGGRFVWELRPATEIDKGSVVRGLARSLQPEALVYVGDDLTDADAFRALRGIEGMRTLAVGVRSNEVPSSAFIDCDLLVEGVAGVRAFLGDLMTIG